MTIPKFTPEPTNPDCPRLTPRELDVLRTIATGASNRRASKILKITEHTVKFHVNALLFKFDADTRTEAVVKAIRAGYISAGPAAQLPEIKHLSPQNCRDLVVALELHLKVMDGEDRVLMPPHGAR